VYVYIYIYISAKAKLAFVGQSLETVIEVFAVKVGESLTVGDVIV